MGVSEANNLLVFVIGRKGSHPVKVGHKYLKQWQSMDLDLGGQMSIIREPIILQLHIVD